MTDTYISSKGEEKLISEMPYPYLKSALTKLKDNEPHRAAEIEAMQARLDAMEEAYRIEQEQQTQAGEAAD